MTKIVRRYFVSGRVQGVGFRYWTSGKARHLGLVGWVRNRRDGRVEILAYGEKSALDLLGRDLESGPSGAKVETVQEAPVTPEEAGLAAEATKFDETPTL